MCMLPANFEKEMDKRLAKMLNNEKRLDELPVQIEKQSSIYREPANKNLVPIDARKATITVINIQMIFKKYNKKHILLKFLVSLKK